MQTWQKVWRVGFAPQLSSQGLRALAQALERDDYQMAQGITVSPPALDLFAAAPIEATCALGYCVWKGEGLTAVSELAARHEQLFLAADEALDEPAGSRFFLDWFDDTPRSLMRRLLLAEVQRTLAQREPACPMPSLPQEASWDVNLIISE